MDPSDTDRGAINRARRSAIFRAAHKRLDPIPRPLGTKRSALHAQKLRRTAIEGHVGLVKTTDKPGTCVLTSADGTTAFAVSKIATALVIEKRHCPAEGPRTSHVMMFEDATVFDHWCDIEPTRFDDPLLCDQLRRKGHELFASHG